MSQTKVIVAGCGIAGPVLAIFLKLKGYHPVVYERVESEADGGLSLMLQANGLRVLALIPGLYESLPNLRIENLLFCSSVPGDVDTLAETDLPLDFAKEYGFNWIPIQRPQFLRLLVETAEKHGIQINWAHKLVSLEEHDEDVRMTFANGHTDTASFVVGCDGLHSNTRASLFGRDQASFTGLTQTGGLSPTPSFLQSKPPTMLNIFGADSHLIAYQASDALYSWAVTRREDEHKETWGDMDQEKQDEFKNGPFSEWGFGGGELVRTANRIIKYGLYDRSELKTWYKGRVVLLGDAAHPTSPHLGQGANQAFEDVYHLIRSLVKHNPSASTPSTELLKVVFDEYEGVRLPRSAELVRKAREHGEFRVVHGIEPCKARNDAVRKNWKDGREEREAQVKSYSGTLNGPFQGESET
jgi:salicylate hydroxylase